MIGFDTWTWRLRKWKKKQLQLSGLETWAAAAPVSMDAASLVPPAYEEKEYYGRYRSSTTSSLYGWDENWPSLPFSRTKCVIIFLLYFLFIYLFLQPRKTILSSPAAEHISPVKSDFSPAVFRHPWYLCSPAASSVKSALFVMICRRIPYHHFSSFTIKIARWFLSAGFSFCLKGHIHK